MPPRRGGKVWLPVQRRGRRRSSISAQFQGQRYEFVVSMGDCEDLVVIVGVGVSEWQSMTAYGGCKTRLGRVVAQRQELFGFHRKNSGEKRLFCCYIVICSFSAKWCEMSSRRLRDAKFTNHKIEPIVAGTQMHLENFLMFCEENEQNQPDGLRLVLLHLL